MVINSTEGVSGALNDTALTPSTSQFVRTSATVFVIVMYLLLVAAFICSIAWTYAFGYQGDEEFYTEQAEYLQQHGLWNAVVDGNPIGFSYPLLLLSKFGLSLLISGRVLSLFSTVPILLGVVIISRKLFGLRQWSFHIINLLSLQVLVGTGLYFYAASDSMFTAVFIWALIFLWAGLTKSSSPYCLIASVLLATSLLIRPLTILYLPGLLACLALGFRQAEKGTARRWFALASLGTITTAVLLFCFTQIPALIEKRAFSFENKDLSDRLTWMKRQTLSQIRYDQGALPIGQHISWEELDQYLKTHGEGSLPSTATDRFVRYPGLVIREFFNDLLVGSNYIFLRRTGILYLAPLLFLIIDRKHRSIRNRVLLFVIFAFSYIVTLCTYILTNVQARWFLVALLLVIISGVVSLECLVKGRGRLRVASYSLVCAFLALSSVLDFKAIYLFRE